MYINRLTYFLNQNYGVFYEFSITIGEIFWDLENFDTPVTTFSGDFDETVNLYSFTNLQLENYPDQENDRIQLMYLLNQAMETLRFKKELLEPQGTVNSDLVRIRFDSSLASETLGHVNTGEEIIILDRSNSKQAIDDMYDYWYRVLSKNSYIKGWMYGAFLDLEE